MSPVRKNGVPSAYCSAWPLAVACTKPRRLAFAVYLGLRPATARNTPAPPLRPASSAGWNPWPAPFARSRGHEADFERTSAVPEAVNTLVEAGALQLDPAVNIDIGVGVVVLGLQNDLLHVPDMGFAARQFGLGRCDEAGQGKHENHAEQKTHRYQA